jgi:hypothetical protein
MKRSHWIAVHESTCRSQEDKNQNIGMWMQQIMQSLSLRGCYRWFKDPSCNHKISGVICKPPSRSVQWSKAIGMALTSSTNYQMSQSQRPVTFIMICGNPTHVRPVWSADNKVWSVRCHLKPPKHIITFNHRQPLQPERLVRIMWLHTYDSRVERASWPVLTYW